MIVAKHLRTEYLYEPMGIDIVNPRFYWNCEWLQGNSDDIEISHCQTAYQIIVTRDDKVIWDSGKVESGSMTHILYEGLPLCSRDHLCWSARLWDENDTAGEFRKSWFEMGLLQQEDWSAKWITGDYEPQAEVRYPVDYFRREFVLDGSCKQARLYISACGLYEARMNGQKIGEDCFTPGCTDYRKRIQYQTMDVTELLSGKTEGILEIELADGWYRGSVNAYGQTGVYGNQTKLICQLEIMLQDGRRQIVTSDENFSWSNDGPLRFSDLKDGETFDANRIPSYCGHAKVVEEPVRLVASNNVPVREKEVFAASKILSPSGKVILDFGQNIAGLVDVRIKGEKDQKIFLRMGEILDENGELTLENIQVKKPVKNFNSMDNQINMMTGNYAAIEEELALTPKQEVMLILSGGDDHYRTKFAVFGFRYAEVTVEGISAKEVIDPCCFHAVAVYSDMEQLGEFKCSNEKVNRLFSNTSWSMKSNFLDIPTDCPTRERLGWTGDAQIFFHTAAYFMDTTAFFRKWLTDVADSQYEDGALPAVVPYAGLEMLYKSTGSSAGWQDAGILIPWRYYQCYGDRRILEQHYPLMKKCAFFMLENAGPLNDEQERDNPYRKYMYVKGIQLGEWLEPKEFNEPVSAESMPQHPEESTAYMHYSMQVMAEAASILGDEEGRTVYKEYAEGAKKAYNWMFLRNGAPDTDRQAKLVRPLALGLSENADIEKQLQDRLVKAVRNYRYRVGTGFLSTPFLLFELTRAGRTDVAYQMLENEEMPGWLAEVNERATTVWENWDGEASRNHYSPGAVCEWLFAVSGGIRVDGENHFHIEPKTGGSFTFAETSYKSIYGEVKTRWARNGQLEVTIPANTCAEVIWNGYKETLKSGHYILGREV